MTQQEALKIHDEACEAGMKALEECQPKPMTVQDTLTGQQWHVPDGMCGFAWVNVKCKGPGRSFIDCLVKLGLASRDINSHDRKAVFKKSAYYGGYQYWVHAGGQSYEKKRAYADAYARVLAEHSIKAVAMSRLD